MIKEVPQQVTIGMGREDRMPIAGNAYDLTISHIENRYKGGRGRVGDEVLGAFTTGDLGVVGKAIHGRKPTGKARQALAYSVPEVTSRFKNGNGNGNGNGNHDHENENHVQDPASALTSDTEIVYKSSNTSLDSNISLETGSPQETQVTNSLDTQSSSAKTEKKKKKLKRPPLVIETSDGRKEIVSFGPKAHVDMLDPNPANVNAGRLISEFFGRDALLYASYRYMPLDERRVRKLRYLQRHPETKAKKYDQLKQRGMNALRAGIDPERFPKALTREYPLPRGQSPIRFYERQMDHANAVVNYALENTAPRHKGVFGLKTEVRDVITDVDELITFAFDTNVDPRAQFEVRRQLVIGMACAEVDVYRQQSGARDKNREVRRILDNKVFEGKLGESARKNFAVVYNKKTNAAVRYDELPPRQTSDQTIAERLTQMPHDPDTEEVRVLPLEMRQFKDSGIMAMYDPRPKPIQSVIAKAFQEALDRKAKGEDGTVYPLQDVEDLNGMLFVVDDRNDPDAIQKAMDQVFGVLVANGIGLDVEEDHAANGTDDQAKDIFFRKRIKLWGKGNNNLPVMLEIMFKSVLDHANNERKIGEFDPERGRHMGMWHEGYDTERLIKGGNNSVARLFWPGEIFDDPDYPIDIEEEAILTKERKAVMTTLP